MRNPSVKPSYAGVVKTGISGKQGTKSPIQVTKFSSAIKGITMDENKLYLDSTDTYHYMFRRWNLNNIRQVDRVLRGNCNAGVTTTSTKGHLCVFDMWLNESGIANLLSIPQLEADGFRVTCDTDTNWVVYTPQGHKIVFQ